MIQLVFKYIQMNVLPLVLDKLYKKIIQCFFLGKFFALNILRSISIIFLDWNGS